ncbi:MAG: hypothetical protein PUB18_06510 [bacterium]|nr:hypothetical protein [bacterium]
MILNELIFIYNTFPADSYTTKLSRTDRLVKVRNFDIQIETNLMLKDDLALQNATHCDI